MALATVLYEQWARGKRLFLEFEGKLKTNQFDANIGNQSFSNLVTLEHDYSLGGLQ